ncbi:cytochrome c [Fluoribacter dumoffii]|uniref:c-type cytochrome n=1 Tax=Fluoribacter dumoffii TaxID=463 RepID=UPI002244651E|nr:cytochrome c [Fluoribacter dumoffii]MCW8418225.1 cytochrome c [Fluoribacter dumoffii]MCW8453933.1 cytochrome c [Fluoribacter dumoffii]MCW8461996.1 cytochrome c [Fluoribacter dumoffii]MCW8482208.1 cytochrome c [Fluoribacter dumoffii]
MNVNGFKFALLSLVISLVGADIFAANKASGTSLRIITPQNESFTLEQSELLSHPFLSQVTIDNDRAYPEKIMHHQVIPLCKLLAPYPIQQEDIIEFIAKDNFHVYVPSAKVMNCDKKASIALLAIEPKSKWPTIQNHTGDTAGPYEVIWLNPELSYISNEYWAWSVVALKIRHNLDYHHVLAPPKTTNASINNGYKIYISHCEGCHRMNYMGKSNIGPDLNCPKNPLEYYSDAAQLRKFIRDPQSVRSLPKGRMTGSDKQSLSDNDLDDLIHFFSFMKTKKMCGQVKK